MSGEKAGGPDLLSMACAALDESDSEKAEKLYNDLILHLKKVLADNQKEMAQQLQTLARQIESAGRLDDAFRFKQRTCEVMLKVAMAERHAGRTIARVESAQPGLAKSPLPFKNLEYLYLGSADFDADLAYYVDVLKAEKVWAVKKFGARVAGLRLAAGPLILLADHKQAPSCQPIFTVDRLDDCIKELTARGFKPEAGPVETPNGPSYVFCDPSGNRFAILQNDRPQAMEKAYADSDSESAIRGG